MFEIMATWLDTIGMMIIWAPNAYVVVRVHIGIVCTRVHIGIMCIRVHIGIVCIRVHISIMCIWVHIGIMCIRVHIGIVCTRVHIVGIGPGKCGPAIIHNLLKERVYAPERGMHARFLAETEELE